MATTAVHPRLALAQTDRLDEDVVRHVASLVGDRKATLRLLLPDGSGGNVLPVIKAFEDATGVTVETTDVAVDDINTQLTLDTLSGNAAYDLALPATFGIPDLAATGVIRKLTEFAAKYEPAGFRESILYSTGDTFDGDIYGFQSDGDTYVMFYHRDWLENPSEQARYADQYGVELSVPQTWEELDRQMRFFHRPDEDRYGGALFRIPGYLAWEWWVRFHAKGIWPLSGDLEPQIASPAGVAALEEMIEATRYLYPHAHSAGLFENWQHFAKGNIYCNIGWGGSQKYFNGPTSNVMGRMLFGPTPGGFVDGQLLITPYFNWGWNYVVTQASTEPELAYLFALFASSSRMSTISVRERSGYFDPFRPEHYADDTINNIYSKEFLAVHEESLRSSIPDLYLASQSEYMQVLSEWLFKAITGDETPSIALERAASQWSLLNQRAGIAEQTRRWRTLREKYPPTVRRVLRDIV